MAILQITDFSNNPVFKIALTKKAETELAALIDDVEKRYLEDLLGCTLYGLFIDDLTATTPQAPQTAPYTTIFNEICEDINFCRLKSEGIKVMLMAFVFYEWHVYDSVQTGASGLTIADGENSNPLSAEAAGLYIKFNRGVATYRAIQQYICYNMATFPDFRGVELDYTSAI